MTAALGLALSTAPNVAHFLPFLGSLLRSDRLAVGIASIFAPTIAAIVFITVALITVNCESGGSIESHPAHHLLPHRGCRRARFHFHLREPTAHLQNDFHYPHRCLSLANYHWCAFALYLCLQCWIWDI